MNKASLTLIAASFAIVPGLAVSDDHSEQDFSTVTKVHYVQDCMAANGDKNIYESVHKCSCVIDKIDAEFTQTQFDDLSTGHMYKNLPADRGAQFRDDDELNKDRKKFNEVMAAAYKECRL